MTIISIQGYSQMRLINNPLLATDDIYKLSFYSKSEGFIVYNHDGLGFTTDSGRTVTLRPLSNIDTNGYHHDFQGNDFDLSTPYFYDVYAKDQNNLFVSGFSTNTNNAFILYSADKGISFKVVYYQYYDNENFGDMVFPQNGNIGYASTPEHILKTIDGGMNWFDINTYSSSFFTTLDVLDNDTLFLSNSMSELYKSINGGSSWQQIQAPPTTRLNNVHFISSTKGWINNYYTTDGGNSWLFSHYDFADQNAMKFINDTTGFVIAADNNIYKTTDAGIYWEKIAKENYTDFEFPGYYKDIEVIDDQLWFGMGTYLVINTNIGAPPLPTAVFRIDTSGVSTTGIVNLQNYSRANYTYKWLLNNTVIGTGYNTSYIRSDTTSETDTIMLIINHGIYSDTAIRLQHFTVYKKAICPNGATSFTTYLPGSGFQWQVNTGTGFNYIINNDIYTSNYTRTLTITNAPSSLSGYQYRCVVDGVNTPVYTLRFENTSLGTSSWGNIANWSCGTIPDGNTDVVISSGTVTISSNAICRSITVLSGAHVVVNAGVTLTVTH